MAFNPQEPLKSQGVQKDSLGINLKTFRSELDLELGTSVVFVVERQKWQRN